MNSSNKNRVSIFNCFYANQQLVLQSYSKPEFPRYEIGLNTVKRIKNISVDLPIKKQKSEQ